MSWQTLRSQAQLVSGPDQLGPVVRTSPDLLFYPGSGHDLTPIVLSIPGRAQSWGRRGDRDGSLLLWMNDVDQSYAAWPEDGKNHKTGDDRLTLWDRHSASAVVHGPVSRYELGPEKTPLAVFKVMRRSDHGERLHTVLFSRVDSRQLVADVILRHELRVRCCMLIRQGGFSRQLPGFQQYQEIPRLLERHARQIGPVASYLVDNREEIPGYRRRPHPRFDDWGWQPVELWV